MPSRPTDIKASSVTAQAFAKMTKIWKPFYQQWRSRRRSRSGAGRANKSAVKGSLRLNNPIKKSQTQQHTWAGPPGCQRQLKSIAAIRGTSTKHTFSNECVKSTRALNHTQVCSLAHLLDLHTPSSVACIVFKDF